MTDEIIVGIPTDGLPLTERQGDLTILYNMLIGKNFHWQKSLKVLLPGIVEIHPESEYSVINRVPLEKYLECVVASEMNPQAPVEFLKAHAVISRSWAIGKITGVHDHSDVEKINSGEIIVNWEDTCDHDGFHVCSDDHCQRYQGVQSVHESVKKALEATRGEVLTAPDGHLVDARFSKCCGGKTELFSTCWQSHEEACLESFADPWCDLSSIESSVRNRILHSILKDYDLMNGGGYSWTTTVTSGEIRDNLYRKFGRDIGEIKDIRILSRGSSGRAKNLRLTGTKGNLSLGKELMIRRLLSPTHLYSSWFDIAPLSSEKAAKNGDAPAWKLKGRGWGHGVGLWQIGAARMALEGYTYKDILSFYYPGSYLDKH